MAVEVKEIDYENYGRCVQITNGLIDVVVTIECGPRMVRFGYVNEMNILYNDIDRNYKCLDESMAERYGKDTAFYYYGGHRVWQSPERMPESYYPDNEPVVYAILPEGVTFTPARQKHNDIQLSFEVMLSEEATDIMVIHSLKNCSKEKQTRSLSAITMVVGGGNEIIPQNQGNGSPCIPNRMIAAWPYTDLHDNRLTVTNKYITISHEPNRDDPLKIGTNNLQGWSAYCCNGYTIVKRFVHNMQAMYPDFGCSYETYLCKDYVEVETLSPLYNLEPGEAIRHVENISLFKSDGCCPLDDDSISKYISELK